MKLAAIFKPGISGEVIAVSTSHVQERASGANVSVRRGLTSSRLSGSAPAESHRLSVEVLVRLRKRNRGSSERVPRAEARADQRFRRVILIGVVGHRENTRHIHVLARERRYALAKRSHDLAEHFLEFFDLPIALIH